MDKFIYFFLDIYLLIIWFVFIQLRKDLAKKIIKGSIFGGIAGLIAEIWFHIDYWKPPTLSGKASISFEDALFGFTITGISVSIYDVIFGKKNMPMEKDRKKLFIILFLFGLSMLLIFNNWLKFNSIFVSSIAFILISIFIIMIRKDLCIPAILSGIFTIIIIIPIYLFLFNYLSPDYWAKYWLLHNTSSGASILGNIPVTEIIWYFAWGSFAGCGYDFGSGRVKC